MECDCGRENYGSESRATLLQLQYHENRIGAFPFLLSQLMLLD